MADDTKLFVVEIEQMTVTGAKRSEHLIRAESAAKAVAQVATARKATADDVERLLKDK